MVKHLEKQHHELFVKMKAMEAEDKIQKKCQSQEKLQLQPNNSILESGMEYFLQRNYNSNYLISIFLLLL